MMIVLSYSFIKYSFLDFLKYYSDTLENIQDKQYYAIGKIIHFFYQKYLNIEKSKLFQNIKSY